MVGEPSVPLDANLLAGSTGVAGSTAGVVLYKRVVYCTAAIVAAAVVVENSAVEVIVVEGSTEVAESTEVEESTAVVDCTEVADFWVEAHYSLVEYIVATDDSAAYCFCAPFQQVHPRKSCVPLWGFYVTSPLDFRG